MHNGYPRPIRIGRIQYTNAWQVFHYFDSSQLRYPTEIAGDMPATLNRKLKSGEIDMSAISSHAFGLSSDAYYLLPDLSVSANGRVQSILLFMKSPLEQVIRGRIALTTTSATSVNLLKIIVGKFFGGNPVYQDAEPALDTMLADADAALLIGDHAIRASWTDHGYEVLDLSEVWKQWTGKWMTFALWAVRRETVARNPEAVWRIYESLLASKKRAYREPEPLIEQAMRQIGGSDEYWRGYFGNLCHDFGPEQQAGLKLYFQYAHELGLMEGKAELAELPRSFATDNLLGER